MSERAALSSSPFNRQINRLKEILIDLTEATIVQNVGVSVLSTWKHAAPSNAGPCVNGRLPVGAKAFLVEVNGFPFRRNVQFILKELHDLQVVALGIERVVTAYGGSDSDAARMFIRKGRG